ncbi:MAG: LacI family DNA-binding transcriptional regulator [Armatimonadota bacterium]
MTLTRGDQTKKLTSQEIARQTGVSRTTVSYVLSGREGVRVSTETRERILQVARQAGYRRNHLAQALISGRMYSVGIVTHADSLRDPENTYIQQLFIQLTLAIRAVKMNAMTFFDPFVGEESDEEGLRPSDLTDGRIDGVILVGHIPAPGWVDAVIRQNGIAYVTINTCPNDASIFADNIGGTRMAVEHLLTLGHQRIAYFTHPASTSIAKRERLDSFQETLMGAGIAEEDAPVVDSEQALTELLQRGAKRPTAIMTFNDELASVALRVFRHEGFDVPQDISLIGFDDDVRAKAMVPPLTTVAMPIQEMAQAAVAELLHQIEGEATSSSDRLPLSADSIHSRQPKIIPARLAVRESTAPPPLLSRI